MKNITRHALAQNPISITKNLLLPKQEYHPKVAKATVGLYAKL